MKEQVIILGSALRKWCCDVLGGPFKHAPAPGPHLVPVALFQNISLCKHCVTAQLGDSTNRKSSVAHCAAHDSWGWEEMTDNVRHMITPKGMGTKFITK